MQIHQLNVEHDQIEDRLLLSVSTVDRQEFRISVTRRFLMAVWPALLKGLEADPGIATQASQDARKAMLSMAHEKAVDRSKFSERYQGADKVYQRPLGDTPLLVVTAKVQINGQNSVSVAFSDRDKRGMKLNMTRDLLHSLCSLLVQVSTRAKWGLDLKIGSTMAPAGSGAIN